MGRTLMDLALLLAALPALAASGYLALLTLLSWRPRAPEPPRPRRSFDLVVPAHDEEAGIARTVRNLLALDYPAGLRRVLVVADNCSDATAARAREAGAVVLERRDPSRRGKGYALAYAFERCLADGIADAVVVIDADTVASSNLLSALDRCLEEGAMAVQAHYGVLNPGASWRTRLMAISLGAFHRVRSLGRERLGLSCGLRGNGMCFRRELLQEVPHDAFSLVEDLEYGLRLGRAGHRVHYAWEAEVLGEMVCTEGAARSQRRRWEGGRRQMARLHARALLAEAARRRSPLLLDLALDVLVPPLSTVALAALAVALPAAGLSAWQGHPALSLAAGLCSLALLAAYVLRGWWVSGVGWSGLGALLWAPAYVGWKLWLRFRAPRPADAGWVRTTRELHR